MLEVRDLTVTKGKKSLLKGISLKVEKGRITALLGVNGSGKTTLLRAVSSFFRKYEGSVLFDGVDMRTMDERQLRRSRFLLPQQLPAVALTVEELLEFTEGEGSGYMPERLSGRRLDSLSGGERALAYIALMMKGNSAYRLLDEPYSSLDPKNGKLLDSMLIRLKEEGYGVVVSIHDVNRALSIADDILVLEGGRLLFSGSKEQFLETDIAESVFALSRRSLFDSEGNRILVLE